jgi:hypothetical protein
LESLSELEDGHTGSSAAPTRVLDLQEDNSQNLRILENVTLCAPYVALSHRWGIEQLPRTTSANLTSHMQGLSLQELTLTMQDAVQVTRSLGYRYLWIDALCIIQDSEIDWLQEAARMSKVFSGAIVTLAVADAENHSQGMFRPRFSRCVRPFPIPYMKRTPYRDRIYRDGEGEY